MTTGSDRPRRRLGTAAQGEEDPPSLRIAPAAPELDEAAFEQIVLLYARPLTVLAWRYLRSEDAAVDLAQDVFADLWEHRADLQIRTSLRAYLFAMTRNRALNAVAHTRIAERWQEREAREPAGDPASATDGPHAQAERAELHAAVEAALRTLPPRAQEIARLRWVERLSRREIAEMLGVAVPTVGVQLARAVKRLRDLLRGFAP